MLFRHFGACLLGGSQPGAALRLPLAISSRAFGADSRQLFAGCTFPCSRFSLHALTLHVSLLPFHAARVTHHISPFPKKLLDNATNVAVCYVCSIKEEGTYREV